MNVQYRGSKTVDSNGEKLTQPLAPVAIVTFTEREREVAVAILEASGYDYDLFANLDEMFAEVAVDGKEDFKDFMREWKEGKEAYNL